MKIAIANTSPQNEIKAWTDYCNENKIIYKLVNPYSNNIVEEVSDCNIFMWHHSQTKYKDLLFAKQLLFSLEQSGKIVYPNFHSNWHFDDKLGQKYLLESIGAPLVKSYAFYDKKEALEWAKRIEYPKVFKLRCGAAAVNVKLIHSYKECKKYINKAFGKGFDSYTNNNIINLIKKVILHVFKKVKFKREEFDKEHGYAYFQDFMPNNEYDTRVVVIGGKYACAERRINRKNDFRASGSGDFSFDNIDINIVKTAFEIAKKLKLQSVAYDFVYDEKKAPRIVEICYGFGVKGISKSPVYYTDDLKCHKCDRMPIYKWIIESIIAEQNNL